MRKFFRNILLPRLLKTAAKEGGEIVYRSNMPIDWIHFRNGRDLTKGEIRSFKKLVSKGDIINTNRCDEIEMIGVDDQKSVLKLPIYTINNNIIQFI
jgi:hypothetical protein